MTRSKEQTTGPFPRRLTRAQRAAERRNNTDEPPSNDDTNDHPSVVAAAEPPPADAAAAASVVEEASTRVESATIVHSESPGPMTDRHLSCSQILAARHHSVAATIASPKTTDDDPTPVTGERNPPLNPPQPPPTVIIGTSTTTLPSNLPLKLPSLTHTLWRLWIMHTLSSLTTTPPPLPELRRPETSPPLLPPKPLTH